MAVLATSLTEPEHGWGRIADALGGGFGKRNVPILKAIRAIEGVSYDDFAAACRNRELKFYGDARTGFYVKADDLITWKNKTGRAWNPDWLEEAFPPPPVAVSNPRPSELARERFDA